MFGIIGIAVIFIMVFGGYLLAGGKMGIILKTLPFEMIMIGGAALMVAGVAVTAVAGTFAALLALWAVVGFGFSLSQTPIGRILNRSARPEDRPAVFAAQFALSHAAWLVTYPLAGWVGSVVGLPAAAVALAVLGAVALVAVMLLWPSQDPADIAHDHADLPPDHPHLQDHAAQGHRHPYQIDDLHRRWPSATS